MFSPDGKIRLCFLNAPDTFHDSVMSDYGIYEGLEKVYDRYGAKVVVEDSASKLSISSLLSNCLWKTQMILKIVHQ